MQLFYKQYGEQGEPLIILHGLFGSQSNWAIHAKRLAQQYCVYAFDARNHGRSQWCSTMSYPEMASDIMQTMDALGVPQAHFIGHSMGGKTLMNLALLAPDRINKLMVVDIAPVEYPAGPYPVLDGLQAIDLDTLESRSQADAVLSEYVEEKGVRDFLLTNLQRASDKKYQWRFNLSALVEHYPQIKGGLSSGPEGSFKYAKEAFFIKGGNSEYILPEYKNDTLKLFPNSKMKVIHGAGHWVHSEKPSAFIKVIESYLS